MSRTCSTCDKPISGRGKSGLCSACVQAAKKIERKCSACGTGITKHSALGRCTPCSNKLRGKAIVLPRCACGAALSRPTATKCWACHLAMMHVVPPSPPRVWCTQCERNVLTAEGSQCRSPWCGAKERAAA